MGATVLFWTAPVLLLAAMPTEACLVYVVSAVLACFDTESGEY